MNWFAAKKYLEYKLMAKDAHALHSPFVYQLYTEVICDDHSYYAFGKLNAVRNKILQDPSPVGIVDLGAGSKYMKNGFRSVADIAKGGITKKKYAELLFRLCHFFNPATSVELGTSVGLTSMYLAAANSTNRVYTLEGNPDLCNYSERLFRKNDFSNIKIVCGNFDETFDPTLENLKTVDLIFFDGNHRKEATLSYFSTALQHAHNNSVFIFDDIYWSEEMAEAWEEIRNHPSVTVSIDLFQFGIVFFRKEHHQKEYYVLRY